MAMTKVSVTLDEEIVVEARQRAGGPRRLSMYVNDALRLQLQRERIDEFLAEAEREHGPVPEEALAEAALLFAPCGR